MTPDVRRIANRLTAERQQRVANRITPLDLRDVWAGHYVAPKRKHKDGEPEVDEQTEFLESLRAVFQRRFGGRR